MSTDIRTAATTKPGQTLPHVPGTEDNYVTGTRSLGTYDFPSRSQVEMYDGDMLVHLWQQDDDLMVTPLTVRVPIQMRWADFYTDVFLPLAHANPDNRSVESYTWQLVDDPFTPEDDKTLAELGVQHKNTLGYSRA